MAADVQPLPLAVVRLDAGGVAVPQEVDGRERELRVAAVQDLDPVAQVVRAAHGERVRARRRPVALAARRRRVVQRPRPGPPRRVLVRLVRLLHEGRLGLVVVVVLGRREAVELVPRARADVHEAPRLGRVLGREAQQRDAPRDGVEPLGRERPPRHGDGLAVEGHAVPVLALAHAERRLRRHVVAVGEVRLERRAPRLRRRQAGDALVRARGEGRAAPRRLDACYAAARRRVDALLDGPDQVVARRPHGHGAPAHARLLRAAPAGARLERRAARDVLPPRLRAPARRRREQHLRGAGPLHARRDSCEQRGHEREQRGAGEGEARRRRRAGGERGRRRRRQERPRRRRVRDDGKPVRAVARAVDAAHRRTAKLQHKPRRVELVVREAEKLALVDGQHDVGARPLGPLRLRVALPDEELALLGGHICWKCYCCPAVLSPSAAPRAPFFAARIDALVVV